MLEKRLQEIKDRKVEIRSLIETEDVNLDEIKTELETLETEERAITEKREIAEKIQAGTIETRKVEKPKEAGNMEILKGAAAPEYRTAFFKKLLGHELNEVEKREFAFTNGLGNATAVVPIETANSIFDMMTKVAPMLNEIDLMRIPGYLLHHQSRQSPG
jgi:HK97 family phage major capsid protein